MIPKHLILKCPFKLVVLARLSLAEGESLPHLEHMIRIFRLDLIGEG
jgi:hypothetical protein